MGSDTVLNVNPQFPPINAVNLIRLNPSILKNPTGTKIVFADERTFDILIFLLFCHIQDLAENGSIDCLIAELGNDILGKTSYSFYLPLIP